jgi:hypothetical protein
MRGVAGPGGAIPASHYVVNEVDFESRLGPDGPRCRRWPRLPLNVLTQR